jgi:hypothetical protein
LSIVFIASGPISIVNCDAFGADEAEGVGIVSSTITEVSAMFKVSNVEGTAILPNVSDPDVTSTLQSKTQDYLSKPIIHFYQN